MDYRMDLAISTILILFTLLATELPLVSSFGVVGPTSNDRSLFSRSTRLFSTSTPTSAAAAAAADDVTSTLSSSSLDKLTVKELKQILQDNGLDKSVLPSIKLKRKQDLLDFLKEHLPSFSSNIDGPTGSTRAEVSTPTDDAEEEDEDSNASDRPTESTNNLDDQDDDNDNDNTVLASFPKALRDKLETRGITQLLPIQSASYQHIVRGNDAVLKSPTGSGKTFAFIWPLCARILMDTATSSNGQSKKNIIKHSSERNVPVSPRILILVPNRELARQVGKEFEKYITDAAPVAAVFGGVPIERHTSLLRKRGGAHVVVATPGRWRELVREQHADYSRIKVVVLDEADVLLDVSDSPDVTEILNHINQAVGSRPNYNEQEYQLVLASATINKMVVDFAQDNMDITPSSKSFFSVENTGTVPRGGGGELIAVAATNPNHGVDAAASSLAPPPQTRLPAVVKHYYTPVKTLAQPSVAANFISSLAPQLCIIFVPTKADTESVADFLQQRLEQKARVRTLHGDLTQAQRSRTISLLRESSSAAAAATATQINSRSQILVATDVASRGLDLPNVDLVIQFGIPRMAGKEGTYNVELFTHRTGRTGRMGMSSLLPKSPAANTIMLYDPAVGEGRLLDDLIHDVEQTLNVKMEYRPIPSSIELVDSAYKRSASRSLKNASGMNPDLVSYFRSRLQGEDASIIDITNTEDLLDKLATTMALLADLDPNMSPIEPTCSSLTGDPSERTVQVYREDDGSEITPPLVTAFCKMHNSGKLGRMKIIYNGSVALFDLPKGRAKIFLETVAASNDTNGWKVEMANHVPDLR